MDITPTTTVLPSNTHETTPPAKSPKHEPETPTRFQPAQQQTVKQGSFPNGVLRRHQVNHHPHPLHHHIPIVVTYKECLKNHAASMGGHALDGCGEFMPSPSASHTDPTSLKCAACGCHRNFHRRESDDHYATSSPPHPPTPTLLPPNATATLEYQPQNRHHPPPPYQQPPQPNQSPNSSSPPPISSSYYPSAPHMLLALSTGGEPLNLNGTANTSPRKRFRTKFTPAQKERMFKFAEKVGWKMQKRDEELIQRFCNEVKVDKSVLKVWMHNNKNTFSKRGIDGVFDGIVSSPPPAVASPNCAAALQDMEDDEDLSIEQQHIPFTVTVPAVNGESPCSS